MGWGSRREAAAPARGPSSPRHSPLRDRFAADPCLPTKMEQKSCFVVYRTHARRTPHEGVIRSEPASRPVPKQDLPTPSSWRTSSTASNGWPPLRTSTTKSHSRRVLRNVVKQNERKESTTNTHPRALLCWSGRESYWKPATCSCVSCLDRLGLAAGETGESHRAHSLTHGRAA